jgi:hypothetical protein
MEKVEVRKSKRKFPFQPFGLKRGGGAATFAARRVSFPKDAPACRASSVDDSTTSATYKDAEKLALLTEKVYIVDGIYRR